MSNPHVPPTLAVRDPARKQRPVTTKDRTAPLASSEGAKRRRRKKELAPGGARASAALTKDRAKCERPEPRGEAAPAGNARPRILVIDDDPLFRSLIASLLRRDYAVELACEGAEGFYKALGSPPDVVIVDVQMPGWDGVRTLKAFRSHPTLAKVGTMILSADASKGTVVTAIHAGADEYLIKTCFSKDCFFEKLSRLLPGSGAKVAAAAPESQPAVRNRLAVLKPSVQEPPAAMLPESEDLDEERLQQLIDEWE